MTLDLAEFHQTFFEESFEAVDGMESSLLELDTEDPDAEAINSIFRGAHSIKGGSAMFGFNAISEFTHVMETLLDQVRNGERALSPALVDLLLRAVDCLRAMLVAVQAGDEIDADKVAATQAQLASELENRSPAATPEPAATHPAAPGADISAGWHITFKPEPGMLRTGNDPLRMFRELRALGALRVTPDLSRLPSFEELDPEEIHLAWDLELRGDIEEARVRAVFDWVDGECELEIEALAATADGPRATVAVAAAPAAAPGAAVEPASEAPTARAASPKAAPPSTSIRVGIDKVDQLINLVGELVITQSMLGHLGEDLAEQPASGAIDILRKGLTQLGRNTRELQESVMRIRMLPIKSCFNRFPRLVHDLSGKLGKQIELRLVGEQTELDKTVLEKINDPLVHAVRNCIDHGIEMPEVRRAAGKPEAGMLELNAYHAGGNIVIEVTDDGAGLPKQKIVAKARERGLVGMDEELSTEQIDNLVFLPGFSTAEQVSDLSGRGVGMDVVRRNINDLGGTVDIRSEEGRGSTLTIRLPLTLAILDGQLVRVGRETYVVSLVAIIESLRARPECISTVTGENELYRVRDEYIPVVRLHQLFGVEPRVHALEDGIIVLVEADGRRMGLFVDELLGQQQVVIKSLESNFRQVPGLSGATILGDGTVALILDAPGLIQRCLRPADRPASPGPAPLAPPPGAPTHDPRQ